jgi:uncharacterized phage protein (predicted DNA packaging)
MTVTLSTAKAHLNVTTSDDDALLTAQIAAAQRFVEHMLGFTFEAATDDPPEGDPWADGIPADIDQAVLLLAAHWYENREATLVGVSAQPLPFGVAEIIANYRTYTFGLADDA